MERNDEDIQTHPLSNRVSTRITYGVLQHGKVPIFDELEAMHWSRHTLATWDAATYAERVLSVAHYRIHHVVEQHRHDAVDRVQKMRSMRKKKRGSR